MPSPEEQVLRDVLAPHLAVAVAVAGLAQPFRAVLLPVDVHGLTYTETAALLDLPLGTVMSRLSRARSRLRHELRSHPLPDGSTS